MDLAKKNFDESPTEENKTAYEITKKAYDENKEAYASSDASKNDITSRGFSISVNDISPGMDVKGGNVKESVNYALGTIIQKMMMAL
jgi:hypothetical protein